MAGKQAGWEDSGFPIVCENCLGDNPYVRMTKESFGGACKICERPYTVFRWKAGTAGRFKCTVTCQACAKLKNTCQVCILDLQYGVPVEVRDTIIAKAAQQQGLAASTMHSLIGSSASAATSDANRQFALMQSEAAAAAGGIVPYSGLATISPAAHQALLQFGRSKAYYNRNLAKLCSFYARGECNRGSECPFRHEMPKEHDDPLNKQNYKDRFFGTQDPVALKMLGKVMGTGGGGGAGGGKGEGGGGDFSSILSPPENSDPTAVTVWVGDIPADCQHQELRAIFQPYGEIRDLHVALKAKGGPCAFIEYATHMQAEAAIKGVFAAGGATIRGSYAKLRWARPRTEGEQQQQAGGAGAAEGAAEGKSAAGGAAAAGFPQQQQQQHSQQQPQDYAAMQAAYMAQYAAWAQACMAQYSASQAGAAASAGGAPPAAAAAAPSTASSSSPAPAAATGDSAGAAQAGSEKAPAASEAEASHATSSSSGSNSLSSSSTSSSSSKEEAPKSASTPAAASIPTASPAPGTAAPGAYPYPYPYPYPWGMPPPSSGPPPPSAYGGYPPPGPFPAAPMMPFMMPPVVGSSSGPSGGGPVRAAPGSRPGEAARHRSAHPYYPSMDPQAHGSSSAGAGGAEGAGGYGGHGGGGGGGGGYGRGGFRGGYGRR